MSGFGPPLGVVIPFGSILDAVCKDGISSNRRADAKEWVINRHAMLWGAAPWTFKQATGDITFTANSQVASMPDIRKFFDDYNTLRDSSTGTPEAYTVVDGKVFVGPKGDGSRGLIVYQMEKPALVSDVDPTGLPDGFDLALVYGARATGYALTNVQALAGEYEQMFDAQVAALANDWLDAVVETGGQVGAYRPGGSWR